MKKVLLSTTAAAAVLVGGAASAAEWSAGVSGYLQLGVGFQDQAEGVGILRDGEIHFKAKLVADNGITFDGRVELEATTSGDQIDENWARVGGSFGSIKVGGDDSAKGAYNNGVIYSPGARVGYYDAFDIAGGQGGIAGNSDAVGIHYDSPDFMGFRVGASFQPDLGADGGSDTGVTSFGFDNGPGTGDNVYSFGASYSNNFDGFGFGISAAYQDGDDVPTDAWHVAGNVSFSGFTIAGGYEDDGSDEYYIGARYSTGPWTVAGGYSLDETAGGDTEAYAAWVSYSLAPGVTANAGVQAADTPTTTGTDVGGLLWMTMSF